MFAKYNINWKLDFFPNSRKYDLYLVTLCLAELQAYINLLSESFDLYFKFSGNVQSICTTVEFKYSNMLLHIR